MINLIELILTAIVSIIAIFAGLITIVQFVSGPRKGKTIVASILLFVVAAVLAVVTMPNALDVVDEYQDYQTELTKQQAEDKEHYTLAQEYLGEGNPFEAIRQLQAVSSHATNYKEVQEQLADTTETYKADVLKEAEGLASAGNLSAAVNVIKTAMFLLPEDENLKVKLEKYVNDLSQNTISTTLTQAEEAVGIGDYNTAISLLDSSLKSYPDSPQLKAKLTECKDSYVKQTLDQASECLAKHDTATATDILNKALEVLPDNKDLKDKLEHCKNITVNLTDLNYLNESGWISYVEGIKTNDDILITKGFTMGDRQSSRTYALDGKYSALVGICALEEDSKNAHGHFVLTISVDEKEYSYEIQAGSRHVPLDIPLANARELTISMHGGAYWDEKLVIGNAVLYKAE